MTLALAATVSSVAPTPASASADPPGSTWTRAACDPATARDLGYFSNQADGDISVFDVRTGRVLGRIPGFRQPWNINVTPDGRTLFVDDVPLTDPTDAAVVVVDTCTRQVERRVPTGGLAIGSMPANGREVYTALYFRREVSVLDTATDHVTRTYPTESVPLGVIGDERGKTLWVAAAPNTVFSIDRATGRSTQDSPITVGSLFPQQLSLSPDGRLLAVADAQGISLIDTSKHAVRTRIVLPGELSSPSYGGFSPDGRYLWMAYFSGQVAVIDLRTEKVVHLVQTGGWAIGVTFSPDGREVYVPTTPPGTVAPSFGLLYALPAFLDLWKPGGIVRVYDAKTFHEVDTIPAGNLPMAIAIPGSTK